MRLRSDHAHSRLALRARLAFNDDLNILVERIQKAQQPIGGKLSQSASQQFGYLRLIDAQKFGSLYLRE